MRAFLLLFVGAALAGCGGGMLPEISADVEATSLANVRSVNFFSLSLPGEKGELFNELLEAQIRRRMEGHLNPGARWTLAVVDVEYTVPNFKQKKQHYKLSLEAELVDMNGVRAWQAAVETPEIEASPEWSEQRVREHLAGAAVDALVTKLPLGRIELGDEKLK